MWDDVVIFTCSKIMRQSGEDLVRMPHIYPLTYSKRLIRTGDLQIWPIGAENSKMGRDLIH